VSGRANARRPSRKARLSRVHTKQVRRRLVPYNISAESDSPITTPREKETDPTRPRMAIARFRCLPSGKVLTVMLLQGRAR
jgi:hypothetical protein